MLLTQQQLNLFSLTNTIGNTLLDYDLIPKYVHDKTKKKVSIERYQEQGDRGIILHDTAKYLISPAILKDQKGQLWAIYPGTRESLVEECLIDFAKNGEYELATGKPGYRLEGGRVCIYFTLYQLLDALKKRGKEYKLSELDEALLVLQKATYQFSSTIKNNTKEQKLLDNRHYISSYTTIENKEKNHVIKSDKIVRVALSHEATLRILEGKYRSYDAKCSLSMKSPLSRYLYKQFSQEWLNANVKGQSGAYVEISMNDMITSSGCTLVDNPTKRKNNMIKAIEELVNKNILQPFSVKTDIVPIKEGRKIIDLLCTVRPSALFVSQQINAHQRFKKSSSLGVQVKKQELNKLIQK